MTSMPLLRITSRWDCLATHQYGRSYCMCQTDKPQPSWIGSHNAISNKEQKMSTIPNTVAIPADDQRSNLVVANADNSNTQHLVDVGDTYTNLLSGMGTAAPFPP